MKVNLKKLVPILVLIICHVTWLLNARQYITPELIFPAWLITNAPVVVSEIGYIYPPALFHIISALNQITGDLKLSVYFFQLTIITILDVLLFFYLYKRLGFKFATLGLVFYIPWQVFFRGNYLWFDIATLPFVALSFFCFETFINSQKTKNLTLASIALALGYLFKVTVFWIYALYVVILIYIGISQKKSLLDMVRNLGLLFLPLIMIGTINFLFLLLRGTFDFTFYWYVIMQNIVYPRISTLPKPIDTAYYLPLLLLLATYVVSCLLIEKYSKLSKNLKIFLYSFTIVSLANIYPRWSDFRAQPFVFFIAIIFTYSLALRAELTIVQKKLHEMFLISVTALTVLVFVNRIVTEIKNSNNPVPDYINTYAPSQMEALIRGKTIFVYDSPLYNGTPIPAVYEPQSFKNIKSALMQPDRYYRLTSWQIALNYVKERKPNVIIVPYQINERIVSNIDLTELELQVKQRYQYRSEIAPSYFIYTLK